jgi:hypothetical protein
MEELLRSGAGAKTDDKIQKRFFHCTLHDYNRFKEVIVISLSFNYWNKNLFMTHYSKSRNANDNKRSGKEGHPYRILFICLSKKIK